MKRILSILGIVLAFGFSGCKDDKDENPWEVYKAWHDQNEAWFNEQIGLRDPETGELFYQRVVPAWASGQSVYMHWFNDREETAMNLVPDYTSTVSTYYKGYLCDGTLFDESDKQPDKMLTIKVSSVVQGWQIALQNMHVGDSVQVIMPYELGYGSSGSGSILPYSALRFNMRLVDIPYYETKP